MSKRILVINPGSTSTKIAVFEGERKLFDETQRYTSEELSAFHWVMGQVDFRKAAIEKALAAHGFDLTTLDGICARGGQLPPCESGTYLVDQTMVDYMYTVKNAAHASNLGCVLALQLAQGLKIPAFICDPVSVDELEDVARVTGFAPMARVSFFHALNHRSMGRKAAAMLGTTYENCNLIICHLGGGVTSAAHRKGRAVEVCNIFDEGCFSMDRAGGLPVRQVVELCFSGAGKEDILHRLETNSGIVSYLGTRDFRVVERRAFEEQDPLARRVFDALAYQLSRDIGSLAAVLRFQVDAIVLTGGMAYSQRLTDAVKGYVEKIAPVLVLPGENEMLSLAQGALRVLHGREQAKKF